MLCRRKILIYIGWVILMYYEYDEDNVIEKFVRWFIKGVYWYGEC